MQPVNLMVQRQNSRIGRTQQGKLHHLIHCLIHDDSKMRRGNITLAAVSLALVPQHQIWNADINSRPFEKGL